MPGSGKSTQIKLLQQNVKSCKVFHVGKFSKHLGLLKKADGTLISGLDGQFLEYVKAEMSSFTILDGFPRSLEQLGKLKQAALENHWELTFVHIALPKGQEEVISLQRQILREGDSDLARIKGKIKRAFECDMEVINALKGNITEIDAMKSVFEVANFTAKAVLSAYFKNDFAQMIIHEIQSALDSNHVGYISRSFIYTQIFNNRFGACQEPNDIDVLCDGIDSNLLNSRRFEVKNALKGQSDINKILENEALSFYKISVKVTKNSFEPIFVDLKSVYETLNGFVSISKHCSLSITKLPKILQRYPMLEICETLQNSINHAPLTILQDFESINLKVKKDEYGGRADWEGYEESESLKEAMKNARSAFQAIAKLPSAPPRWSNKNLQVLDTCKWEICAKDLDDNSFREYLHQQVNSRKGQKDDFIRNIMEYNFARGNFKTHQKVSHQGRALHLHLVESALQLQTDQLPKVLRIVLRTAMMFHDAGKIKNGDTPGSHQGIGAKMFSQNAPKFLTNKEVELATFLIKYHDIFGRMYRGITEEGYTGAIHPVRVRQIIESMPLDANFQTKFEACMSVWKADVSSVSSLRWLLELEVYVRALFRGL